MIKMIFFLGLISSVGSWVLWLSLGPYYCELAGGVESMGEIGSLRQFFFIFGVIQASYLSDHSHPHKMFYRNELAQIILGALLFVILYLKLDYMKSFILLWTSLRFIVAGQSFIYGFKVINRYLKSVGDSGVLHFLMTQGAVLFGSIIAFFFSKDYFSLKMGLYLDVISSLGLVYIIKVAINKEDYPFEEKNNTIGEKIYDAVTIIFRREFFPENVIYLLLLISVCGFSVISWKFSLGVNVMGKSIYSLYSFAYGIIVWISSYLISGRALRINPLLILGACCSLFSGLLFTLNEQGAILNMAFYLLSSGIYLVCGNKLVLDKSPHEISGRLRSSMLFYLSIIFGAGEFLMGKAFHYNFIEMVGWIKIIASFFILIFLFHKNKVLQKVLLSCFLVFFSTFLYSKEQKIVYKRPLSQSFE